VRGAGKTLTAGFLIWLRIFVDKIPW